MGSEKESLNEKDLLDQILQQFDAKDKQELASQLVEGFKLARYGESYSIQLARLLNRSLTEDEQFKLDILYRVLNYHGSGGEEEEE